MGENRGTGWPVILAHTPVIYMFTPNPPTPTKSLRLICSFCTHIPVLVQVRVRRQGPVCRSCLHVHMSGLQSELSLPGKVLQQEFGVEKVSSAPLICDMEPKWALSHFRLAASNAAQSQLQHCQKPAESAEKNSILPKISSRC